jgi:hypothetical protein
VERCSSVDLRQTVSAGSGDGTIKVKSSISSFFYLFNKKTPIKAKKFKKVVQGLEERTS